MKKRVEQVTQMKYICDVCGEGYDTEEAALACEQKHKEKEAKRIADQKRHEEYVMEQERKQEFLKQNPPKFKRGDVVKYTDGCFYCVMRHFVSGKSEYNNWYALQRYGWYDHRHDEHHEDKTIEKNLALVATKEDFLVLRDRMLVLLKEYGIDSLELFDKLLTTVEFAAKHPCGSLDDWE